MRSFGKVESGFGELELECRQHIVQRASSTFLANVACCAYGAGRAIGAQNDLVGLVSRESVVADSEGGGVKAFGGAAQEWRHLLGGTIYPPAKLNRT
jgi:hypothetical protein